MNSCRNTSREYSRGESMKLESGRVIKSNRGIFGLDENLQLTEGYDGYVYFSGDSEDPNLTFEEKAEIAAIMIKRWAKWIYE